jgi:DNA-directed RNA polymerase specialized sigma24 family protein
LTAPGQGAGQDIFREVLKLQGLICAVLRKPGVPEADVPDLLQDVLVIAHRRIVEGGFCPPDPTKPLPNAVAAWLTAIAKNLARDLHRSLAVHARVFVDEGYYSVDMDAIIVPGPEAPLLAKEELQFIATLKLSAGQHKVVALASLGFNGPEIAAKLGVPLGTVFTWLRRVRLAWEKAKGKRGR